MLNPAQFPAMSITAGGHTKDNLRQALDQAGIQCNAHADALLDDPRFTISPEPHAATVLFITVAELGLPKGANLPVIFAQAENSGLTLCPLELAVDLRLQWRDQGQSTNHDLHRHEAPQGAVTVASPVADPDPGQPKGYYLRNVGGQLWLRGYICDDEYIWQPADQFAFLSRK